MKAGELHLNVPLSAEAPRQARHALGQYGGLEPSLLVDVRLLCSELVANAVQHSAQPTGDPIMVSLSPGPFMLRGEVADGGNGTARLTPRSVDPPSGLQFVELLSDRWGTRHNSFHVWFEIDTEYNDLLHRKRPAA